MSLFPHKRIIVIGVTGAGKSTLASRLAEKLGVRHIELDALYWRPNWVGTPDDEFALKVWNAISEDAWIMDGNYSRLRQMTWSRADAIVWLDYPLPLVFWRLFTRTVRRSITREELWNTNIESFWTQLKLWSDDSLFHWLFQTYWRRKRMYSLLLASAEYSHLGIFHFKKLDEVEKWFESIS